MQGPLAIYSLTHRFDHHQEAQPSIILLKTRYSLERKHTACTQKITRNCHTGNTSAKYTTTNALRNYKKNQRNGRSPTRGNYKKPKTKALLFLTQTTEMMISEKQISTRPPSTNKHHATNKTHAQEKKHARRRRNTRNELRETGYLRQKRAQKTYLK